MVSGAVQNENSKNGVGYFFLQNNLKKMKINLHM